MSSTETVPFAPIFATLQSAELESQWRDMANDVDVPQTIREEEFVWIHKLRDDFVKTLSDITDTEDMRMTLAIRYIELKCAWIQFNTTNNYCLMNTGNVDGRSVLKSCLLSHLLGNVESLLKAEEIAQISDFLSRPINT